VARPAHVKVFTAEETDRAGDKGHLHAITLHGTVSAPKEYYSFSGLSYSVFVRASVVPYSRRRPRNARMADSVLWNHAKSRTLSALTKASLA